MKTFALVALLLVIALPAYAQLPNHGFEEWEHSQQPAGWTPSPGVSQNEAAYTGNYAVSVNTWYISSLGYIIAGEAPRWFETIEPDLKHTGVPLRIVPKQLTGFYKYEPGENRGVGEKNDSAAIYVMVKRFDSERNEVDTISFVKRLLPPSSEWIPFAIDLPLTRPGLQPDSIALAFYSSDPLNPAVCGTDSGMFSPGSCCYFSVDDIALTEISGVSYSLDRLLAPTHVVPNPVANGTARFEFEGEEGTNYTLRVHDAIGQLALEREGVGTEIDLSDLDLAAGSYYITVIDYLNGPIAAGRFIVE